MADQPEHTERAVIELVAQVAIDEIAPEESMMVGLTAERYFDDPDGLLDAARTSRDEKLGFGVDAAVTLAAPVMLAVASDVVRFLFERIKQRFADEAADSIYERITGLFRRDEPAAAPPEFDAAEIAHVRSLTEAQARRLGLDDARAVLLGDAIAGRLAVPRAR